MGTRYIDKRTAYKKRVYRSAVGKLQKALNDITEINFRSINASRSNDEAIYRLLRFYDTDRAAVEKGVDNDSMFVECSTEGNWIKEMAGPQLAKDSSGRLVALLPTPLYGYFFYDEKGKRRRLTGSNSSDFVTVFQFCKPYPPNAFGIRDLLGYIYSFCSISDIVLAVYLNVMLIIAGLLPAYFTGKLLGSDLSGGFNAHTAMLLAAAALSFVCIEFLNTGVGRLSKRLTQIVAFHFTSGAAGSFMTHDSAEVSHLPHSKVWKTISDTYNICEKLILMMLSTPGIVALLLGYSVMAYLRSKSIMLLFMVLIVLHIGLIIARVKKIQDAFWNYMMTKMKESDFDLNIFNTIAKIKESNSQILTYNKRMEHETEAIKYLSKKYKYTKSSENLNTLFPVLALALLILFCAKLGVPAHDIAQLSLISGMIFAQTNLLAAQIINVSDSLNIWKLIKELLYIPETEEVNILPKHGSMDINLRNVSFTYPDMQANIIDNITFRVRSGEYLAIVGASGCGKSTLLKLLLRMEKPTKGNIYFGKVDLNNLDRRDLINRLGIVMQNEKLFVGTIRENMCMKRPVPDEEIWKVLEDVGIDDKIKGLPYGLDTQISSEHSEFSGGQVQRLLIARAIVSKPSILLLDEATSALDNLSQQRIKEALDKIECTRIVVAHRLSTIKDCSRIILLENGVIAEEGTYDQLIAKQGKFYSMVQNQMS